MSTATREIEKSLNDGTLATNQVASGVRGIDVRRRRFALNPGGFMWMLEARESGRQEMLLPVGLIPFRTVPMAAENFSIENVDVGHYQHQVIEDFPAEYFLKNALIRYAEHGMRELPSLTLMDDPLPNEKGNVTKEQFRKSAQGYFAALWPSFADIGHQCPTDLDECVTCRLELLGDPSLNETMHSEIAERTSKLEDQSKVAQLRAEIVECEKAFLVAYEARWAAIVGELADRKTGAPAIAKLGPGEHHVRRHLHAVEPSEAATAAGFGMEVAAAQAESMEKLAIAFREGAKTGDNSEVVALVAQMQRDQAAAQARTDAILEQLARAAAKPEPVKE